MFWKKFFFATLLLGFVSFQNTGLCASDDTFQTIDLSAFPVTPKPNVLIQNGGRAILIKSETSLALEDELLGDGSQLEERFSNSNAPRETFPKLQKVAQDDPERPMPEYPELAKEKGLQGTVILKALVDRSGIATQVWVEQTSGHIVLDERALETVKKWSFEPSPNAPSSRSLTIPIKFALRK